LLEGGHEALFVVEAHSAGQFGLVSVKHLKLLFRGLGFEERTVFSPKFSYHISMNASILCTSPPHLALLDC
jgi:hypothetical protein